MTDCWISVRNWRSFQHYDPTKRIPPWIKNHTELLHHSEYLRLAVGTRSLLHGLWLEYASSLCQLRLDTTSLSRRLNLRVTKQQVDTLVDAGFIDIVASKELAEGYREASAALASRAPAHSREVETEAETETPLPPSDIPLEDLPPFASRADELRAVIEKAKAAGEDALRAEVGGDAVLGVIEDLD